MKPPKHDRRKKHDEKPDCPLPDEPVPADELPPPVDDDGGAGGP